MEQSSIFSKPKATSKRALTIFSNAIKYVELSTELEKLAILTTSGENDDTNLTLILLSLKDLQEITNKGHSEILATYSLLDDNKKPIYVVLGGAREEFGSVSQMQKTNEVLRTIFSNCSSTLIYDSAVTYNDYLSSGIKEMVESSKQQAYIQLHNILMVDEGGVIEEYVAL